MREVAGLLKNFPRSGGCKIVKPVSVCSFTHTRARANYSGNRLPLTLSIVPSSLATRAPASFPLSASDSTWASRPHSHPPQCGPHCPEALPGVVEEERELPAPGSHCQGTARTRGSPNKLPASLLFILPQTDVVLLLLSNCRCT